MQTAKRRLKDHVWLLTAMACFLLVFIFPAGRESAGYLMRHDGAGAWRNAVSMLRSIEYGPPGVNTRPRLNDLLRLAERTNQPHHWLVAAEETAWDYSTLRWYPASTTDEQSIRRALPYLQRALDLAPHDPLLNARAATHYAYLVKSDRPEENPNMPHFQYPDRFAEAEWKAAILCVERGKAADPNNAFFDYARAAFLFAVKRDKEALVAIHAGSRKPDFNDYNADVQRAYAETLQAIGVPRCESQYAASAGGISETSFYLARLRSNARMLSHYAQKRCKAGNAAAVQALCADGMKMGAHLRDKGNTFIHALVGIAIQAVIAKAAGPFTSNEMGVEMRKNVALRGKINKWIARSTKEMTASGLIHAEALKLVVLWLLIWALLMTLLALLVAIPARNAPEEATRWQTYYVVMLIFFLLGVVVSVCAYGWAWNVFAEKKLTYGRAETLLPWFAALLLALPPLSVMAFTFIYAWKLKLSLPRRSASFYQIFCGCLRTAARTSAVTFAVTAVVLLPFLTHYRTKATDYLRHYPTQERKRMDVWLAGLN